MRTNKTWAARTSAPFLWIILCGNVHGSPAKYQPRTNSTPSRSELFFKWRVGAMMCTSSDKLRRWSHSILELCRPMCDIKCCFAVKCLQRKNIFTISCKTPHSVSTSDSVLYLIMWPGPATAAGSPNSGISTKESSCQAKKRTSFLSADFFFCDKFIANFAEYWNYIFSAKHNV